MSGVPNIPIGVPIEIDGKEVIIFRDVIGTESLRSSNDSEVLTIVEPEAADGRPPIFIDESWLIRLRDAYPGIPVYGLWQLLFANNKVPLGNEVIVYPLGPANGLYIRLNRDEDLYDPRSILSSSEYIDNFVSELMEYDFNDATRIDVSIDELRLPSTPAYTRAEIFDRNRQIEQRRWIFVGGFCLALALGTGVFNYALYAIYSMNMTAYANKQIELQTLNERLTELQSRRLVTNPDDTVVLGRLADLVAFDPRAASPVPGDYGVDAEGAISSLSNPEQMLVSSKGYSYDLSKRFPWLTSTKTPEDRYIWTFGSGVNGGEGN